MLDHIVDPKVAVTQKQLKVETDKDAAVEQLKCKGVDLEQHEDKNNNLVIKGAAS